MNYHFMIDEKFIDDFISSAEKISVQKNKYIFTFAKPGEYVSSTKGIHAPYKSKILKKIVNNIKPTDRVYIHWFNEEILDVISKVDHRTKIYLFFWGGDFVEQAEEFNKFIFDEKTKEYIKGKRTKLNLSYYVTNLRFLKIFYKCIYYGKKISNSNYEFIIRKEFLQRINYFCHWNELDYKMICQAYECSPSFLNFFYSPNLTKIPSNLKTNKNGSILIWLGNSGTETNNHLDAIMALSRFRDKNVKIICPLSYGSVDYINDVHHKGRELFGDKWTSIKNFMPHKEYFALMARAKVVVMYHNRTQAAGNIFASIKMGKKVYLKKQSTIYKLFLKKGIVVYDSSDIKKISYQELSKPLSKKQIELDIQKISELFSENKRLNYLKKILN